MGLSASSLEICCTVSEVLRGLRRPAAAGGQLTSTHLHLRVSPAGDLDDHVEDGLLLIGIQWDVVPWRYELAVLFDEDTVLERVGRANLARGIRHGG